jgi:hypothetical protein
LEVFLEVEGSFWKGQKWRGRGEEVAGRRWWMAWEEQSSEHRASAERLDENKWLTGSSSALTDLVFDLEVCTLKIGGSSTRPTARAAQLASLSLASRCSFLAPHSTAAPPNSVKATTTALTPRLTTSPKLYSSSPSLFPSHRLSSLIHPIMAPSDPWKKLRPHLSPYSHQPWKALAIGYRMGGALLLKPWWAMLHLFKLQPFPRE